MREAICPSSHGFSDSKFVVSRNLTYLNVQSPNVVVVRSFYVQPCSIWPTLCEKMAVWHEKWIKSIDWKMNNCHSPGRNPAENGFEL
jgi:hypothetical protein